MIFAFYLLFLLFQKPISGEVFVVIPKNPSISQSIDLFAAKGALKPKWAFGLIAKSFSLFTNKEIKSGKYKLNDAYNNVQILKLLFSSKQKNVVRVTIPEGKDLEDFAEIISQKVECESSDFMKYASNDSLLKAWGINGKNVEGYLMPNTYDFYVGQEPKEIIDRLLHEQKKLWDEKFNELLKKSNLNKREILTLASIVEAETSAPEERPIVAGAYLNRLKIGMKLEADPTVQYAIGKKKRLTYKDLEFDSHYNTYKYAGLPPGPINNPSYASILAALEPAKHKYIYFVAIGDGSGKHNFSTNERQHLKYVETYRKNKRDHI